MAPAVPLRSAGGLCGAHRPFKLKRGAGGGTTFGQERLLTNRRPLGTILGAAELARGVLLSFSRLTGVPL